MRAALEIEPENGTLLRARRAGRRRQTTTVALSIMTRRRTSAASDARPNAVENCIVVLGATCWQIARAHRIRAARSRARRRRRERTTRSVVPTRLRLSVALRRSFWTQRPIPE